MRRELCAMRMKQSDCNLTIKRISKRDAICNWLQKIEKKQKKSKKRSIDCNKKNGAWKGVDGKGALPLSWAINAHSFPKRFTIDLSCVDERSAIHSKCKDSCRTNLGA